MSEPPIWSGLALVKGLDAYVLGRPPYEVRGISIDSRTLSADDLFVALRGDNGDGHQWVRSAFERGAAAAVIDEAHVESARGSGPLFVVRDTASALTSLGAESRRRSAARVAAVTGSVGKTSTKEALRLALGAQAKVHASAFSYNNHWGVPLSLARMPQDSQFGVFEIGMNHAGEIAPLARLVRPHVAIVTTIAPVHLENLGTIEAIADAKAEIFEGLEPGGTAVLPRDVAQFERLRQAAEARGARILTFGEREDLDARLIEIAHQEDASRIAADSFGRRIWLSIGAPGRHFAVDALAVLLAVHALGADVEAAVFALASFAAPKGRGRRVKLMSPGGTFTLIDESYNANPASMRAAIEVLGQVRIPALGNRIAALGDMLELGPRSADMHVALREDLIGAGVNQVFAAGPMMRQLYDALPAGMRGAWAADSGDLLEPLSRAIASGDVVMIKGSNGSRMGFVAEALEKRFCAPAPDPVS